ncbi:helix-turn-helix transcriptional regulator [Brevibacterium linens]|uniref:Transcriptional regulator, AlpA family n=1 Tax=Brevibacterium linens ATCC 9172 TaxID=1255617 RepID=A0A2H1KJT7_BRELN|nr:helix-turn-helix domain-containing protein [Brevibacterium linens]KAB1943810.1 helix-turn-helix domain-containing protein [Brevibacterium linens ATCC 9172]SMY00060.1 transcriptional regulator, AlpA family [Brevibacterium linens ATCC 9172]
MTTTPVDRLLYIEEVAEMIRKTPAAFRYMIQRGDAPKSAKIGGRRMFKESDVEAWIQEQFDKAAS